MGWFAPEKPGAPKKKKGGAQDRGWGTKHWVKNATTWLWGVRKKKGGEKKKKRPKKEPEPPPPPRSTKKTRGGQIKRERTKMGQTPKPGAAHLRQNEKEKITREWGQTKNARGGRKKKKTG